MSKFKWFTYRRLVLAAFIIPIVLSMVISLFHVITWWGLTNPVNWAIFLSIAIEVAVLSSVAASRFSKLVYVPFALVTFIQIIGNIFYNFQYIDPTSQMFRDWILLIQPVVDMAIGDFSGVAHRRLLAVLAGSIVPIIAMVFFHLFVKESQIVDVVEEVIEEPKEIIEEPVIEEIEEVIEVIEEEPAMEPWVVEPWVLEYPTTGSPIQEEVILESEEHVPFISGTTDINIIETGNVDDLMDSMIESPEIIIDFSEESEDIIYIDDKPEEVVEGPEKKKETKKMTNLRNIRGYGKRRFIEDQDGIRTLKYGRTKNT